MVTRPIMNISLSRAALLAGVSLALPMAAPGYAQDTPQSVDQTEGQASATDVSEGQPATEVVDGEEEDAEEIVVTGQRPRGSVIGDIPPEDTLDSRDVRATGAPTY